MNYESRQSIYLLNNLDKIHTHENLQSYQRIVKDFGDQGEFLSYDHNREALACYDCDAQSVHTMPPLLVFRPSSLSIIPSFIHTCNQLNLPITARCGGSGLVGCAVASQGGIVLLTGHFRSIIQYDQDQGTLVVEPGVTPKQVKQLVHPDNWDLPLEIMSEGIAGLAGCLSNQAKGYHQTNYCITQNIISVVYIDGTGQERNAPASLFCGAEGMLGVIIQLHLRLHRRVKARQVYQCTDHFDLLAEHLPRLSSFIAIKSIIWENHQKFTCILEGDYWRLEPAYIYLKNYFSDIKEQPTNWILDIRFPKGCPFFLMSANIPFSSSYAILSQLEEGCREYGLKYELWMNILENTMYILLSSEDDSYRFLKKLERWLTWWVHILEMYQGSCIGRHGIGPFLRHYIPPFYREEDLVFLRKFFATFDDKQLFSRGRFFPSIGKSLEKVVISDE